MDTYAYMHHYAPVYMILILHTTTYILTPNRGESLEQGDLEPWSAPSSPSGKVMSPCVTHVTCGFWASGRREVRIRNLPLRPAEELKDAIRDELARLWRVVLNRQGSPVEIDKS